ncbi:MAG: sugar ABC transporter substrate-binding protein [Actinobacteria bacterium]|nr:sugar ABC transporter substrate-binding protein [Actinomycetota bacterium]
MKKILIILLIVFFLVGVFIMGVGCKPTTVATETSVAETTVATETSVAETTVATETSAAETEKQFPGDYKIAFAALNKADEWMTILSNTMVSMGKELGFKEINVQDANNDPEKQIQQIEDFISKGYDILAVDPVNAESLKDLIKTAADSGMTIWSVDSPGNWDEEQSWIGWDNSESGRLVAEYVANYCKEKGIQKPTIGILHMFFSPICHQRVDSFLAGLDEYLGKGNIEVMNVQEFNVSVEGAANVVSNYAKDPDIVFAVHEIGAWGAQLALQEKNAKDVIVVAAGGYGEQLFTSFTEAEQPFFKMSTTVTPKSIIETFYKGVNLYYNGKASEIQKVVSAPQGVVTHETAKEFLDQFKKDMGK